MTATCTVATDKAWLTDPLDPLGAAVAAYTRRPSDPNNATDGEYRQFAGGRVQLATYDTSAYTVPIVLCNLTPAEKARVEAWIGQALVLRTFDGSLYVGAYLSVIPHLYLRLGVWDCEITLRLLSFPGVPR